MGRFVGQAWGGPVWATSGMQAVVLPTYFHESSRHIRMYIYPTAYYVNQKEQSINTIKNKGYGNVCSKRSIDAVRQTVF